MSVPFSPSETPFIMKNRSEHETARVENANLSVVVALTEPRTLPHVTAFVEQARDQGADLIVVDGVGLAEPERLGFLGQSLDVPITWLSASNNTLVPELWALGVAASDSRYVALTTSELVPGPNWLAALIGRARGSKAAVVGGPIALDPRGCPEALAVYLLRYTNYHPAWIGLASLPPGDNALYDRRSLDRVSPDGALWADGFWEHPIDRALSGRGERFCLVPEAVLSLAGPFAKRRWLGHRASHAARFARDRASFYSPTRRQLRILAAPAIFVTLLVRSLRGGLRCRLNLSRLVRVAPFWIAGLAAWTFGEAWGTWRSLRDPEADGPSTIHQGKRVTPVARWSHPEPIPGPHHLESTPEASADPTITPTVPATPQSDGLQKSWEESAS